MVVFIWIKVMYCNLKQLENNDVYLNKYKNNLGRP